MRDRGGESGRVDQEGSKATGRTVEWAVKGRRRVDRLGRSVLGESFVVERGGGRGSSRGIYQNYFVILEYYTFLEIVLDAIMLSKLELCYILQFPTSLTKQIIP